MGRPQTPRNASLSPPMTSAVRESQRSDVRMSSHTTALCSGLPVRLDHATVVSRWLVMPTHATSDAVAPPGTASSAFAMHVRVFA